MPGPDKLGRNISSRNRQSTSVPHGRSSAGESQMAITAIDHVTTEHGIHDECLRWTFECIDVASPVLERLPAKPRRRSESGYQNNRVRCRPFRLE
jgi:hypothetical protein